MRPANWPQRGWGIPPSSTARGSTPCWEHRAGGLEGYSHYTRKDILKFGSPIGCVEPGAEGLQYGHTDSGIINVAGAALMAVTNGVMPEESDNMFAGKLLTFESGAPGSFQTFEAFYDAVKAQIKYAIDEAHANLLICEKLLAEQFNLPTFTVLLEGRWRRGRTHRRRGQGQCGAHHEHVWVRHHGGLGGRDQKGGL